MPQRCPLSRLDNTAPHLRHRGCTNPGMPSDSGSRLEPGAVLTLLDAGRHPTGLICPDCGGVVTVEVVGRHFLHFACRVGHTYALEEFLAEKERVFEAHLWSTVYVAEELASFLEALEAQGRWPARAGDADARRRQLQEHGRTLRALIHRDQPLADGDETAEPPQASR
jgi:hypothetical protein